VARSPDLATSATEGQVTNPDPGGKPAVKQTAGCGDSLETRAEHPSTVDQEVISGPFLSGDIGAIR